MINKGVYCRPDERLWRCHRATLIKYTCLQFYIKCRLSCALMIKQSPPNRRSPSVCEKNKRAGWANSSDVLHRFVLKGVRSVFVQFYSRVWWVFCQALVLMTSVASVYTVSHMLGFDENYQVGFLWYSGPHELGEEFGLIAPRCEMPVVIIWLVDSKVLRIPLDAFFLGAGFLWYWQFTIRLIDSKTFHTIHPATLQARDSCGK